MNIVFLILLSLIRFFSFFFNRHGAVPEEEMMKNRIELSFRDACAHLLIPLNQCRKETWSSPNNCHHERHIYEKCQYIE